MVRYIATSITGIAIIISIRLLLLLTLTTQEKTVFDSVINYFCCYSGKVLEHFTHNETPWLSARKDLSASAPSERIITQESIHEYFSAVKDKYHMVTPNDIRVYAQDMFTNL